MQQKLTLDDLERIAFKYGGTIMRNPQDNTCVLVGAMFAGRPVTLGPVPGPVVVEAVA